MLLRKFCLPRNFLQVSRVLRPDFVNKNLQQCRMLALKITRTRESQFLSEFVPNYSPAKNETILDDGFLIEDDYSAKTPDEVAQAFKRLSHHCNVMESSITEEKYDPLINALVGKICEMTDEEVIDVLVDLTRFPPCYKPRAHNFSELWNTIDNECWNRSKHWNFQLMLRVMNAYYHLGLNKISKFNIKAVLKMGSKIEQVTPKMLTEFMFYQSIIRHKEVPMYNIEARVDDIFEEFSLDELGIIGLAFFKRESKILNPKLLQRIYEKLIHEIDNVKDITLVNLAKIIRYSSKPSHCILMNQLFDVLVPRIDKFNLLSCMHVALIGINLQNCHKPLIVKILERMNADIKQVRLKDIDRMSLVVSLYDIKTESGIEMEFMRNVLEELKVRVDEITKHPRCFTSTLHYLSMKGVYDTEMIAAALKESFLYFAFGKNMLAYSREILCLESFSKINLKGIYNGPELPEKIRKCVATYQSMYVPYKGQKFKLTHTDKLLLDVKEYAEIKFGYNVLTQVLPHYERPDIIYCFDENGKSVTAEIEDCFQPRDIHTGKIYSSETVLSQKSNMDMNKYRMLAIVIGGWNFYLRDSTTPTGTLRLKLEQLKLIGYIPVLVCWDDWANKPLHIKEEIFLKKMNEALRLEK